MKKICGLLLLTCLCINAAYSQEKNDFVIKGAIYADNKITCESALVQLLKSDRETIVKIEIPDGSGNFELGRVPSGEYFLSISGPNVGNYLSDKIELTGNIDLGKIKLLPKTTNLKEVNISAAKPLIEQFYDKTVVNVDNSITAVGSTTFDVLSKSPGVTIDKDDNIAMRGRQGVLVMIDGKLVPITGTELATMLRNMPANQIDKIELITNPSARYDAQGNSGIIDIRLKKDTRRGTNGSLTASYGQGKYGKTAAGFSLNNRTAKLNLFGYYNYNDRNAFNQLEIMRTFYDPNNLPLGGYNENNHFKINSKVNSVRFGADYYITPKTIIGFVANGLYFKNDILINNSAFALNNLGQDTSSFKTGAYNPTKRSNNSINLNFKSTLDTLGKELSADLDYANYDRTDLQNYITRYYNLQNTEDQTPYALYGDLVGRLAIKSAKADYTQPLSKHVKLEAGLKSSWVTSDNNVNYFNQSNGGNVLDTTKSNHFVYKENINAAYVNASGQLGQASLQFGLRVENTNASGVQLTGNSSFDNHYTQLFPDGFFGYKLNKDNDLGLSVSRRINRPTYSELNPFKIYLDPTTYIEGNPYIKPEITNSYEFSWTFKQVYLVKIGYSTTTNNILNILSPDALNSNVVVETFRNIAEYDYYNISLSIPFTIAKWLSSYNNAVFYYGKYNGNVVNTVLNDSKVAFNLNSTNSFNINKSWTAEISGNYQSSDIYGFQSGKSYGSLDLGAQTKLFADMANLKFAIADILYTNYYRGHTALTGYKEDFIQHNDTRVATISFTYKFGNGKIAPSRRKLSGVEDEKRRAS